MYVQACPVPLSSCSVYLNLNYRGVLLFLSDLSYKKFWLFFYLQTSNNERLDSAERSSPKKKFRYRLDYDFAAIAAVKKAMSAK